ncbi:MAG TPA: hypothetical protein VGC65_04395 [Bacteroidia bacterium]|jgi:hypothetical protein
MGNQNYLPNGDSGRVTWFGNAKIKLPGYQTVLGLTAGEITQFQKDADAFIYTVSLLDTIKQSHQNTTAYKNMLKDSNGQALGAFPAVPAIPSPPATVTGGVFDRVRALMQRIKTAPGYTEAIGQDLNIIAPKNVIDVSAISPELKGKLDVGRPHLKWQKGIADSTDLYADYNDGNGFHLIGRFTRREFIDSTPIVAGKVADEFRYKAMFVIDDEQVGLMSQVFTITVLKQ